MAMQRWFIKLSNKLSYNILSSSSDHHPCDVDKGFLPVYVGDSKQRFVIPVTYLNFNSLQSLLEEPCEEEANLKYNGGLQLRCDVTIFELAVEQAQNFFTSRSLKSHEVVAVLSSFRPS